MSIAENLQAVNEAIARACERAGRARGDVKLVAVSKTKPLSMIAEAYRAGQLAFGENYVQEAVEKAAALPEAEWHFIGSLQTNKVKQVAGRFHLIHSVDREKLASEISKVCVHSAVVQDVLLQIHVGPEETKHGATIEEAPALIRHALSCSGLRLRGIMSLPPLTEDERVARGYFADLREAFSRWRHSEMSVEQAKYFTELSMGTSSDFEWAILEGATMVRVGTSIFGARQD